MVSFAKWSLHVCRTSYDLWLQFPLVMHSKMEQRFRNEHCWPANLLWQTIIGSNVHQRYKHFGKERVKNHIFTIVLHQSETLPTESQAKCWFTVLDIAVNSNASQVKRINNERIIMFTFHLFTTERSIQRQALPGVFPVSHKRIISGLKTNLNLSPSYSFHKSLYHKSLVLEPQLNVKYLI